MFKLFVPLSILGFSLFLIETEDSQAQNNQEEAVEKTMVNEDTGRHLQFQAKLVAIEEERLFADYIKEQERIVARKQQERLETERKLAEEERLAEAERLAAEQAKEVVQTENTQEDTNVASATTNHTTKKATAAMKEVRPATKAPAQQNNQGAASAPQQAQPAPAPRTDGFNFNGHHFSLASFTGGGKVPQETNHVYQWTDKPDHFLIERISPAGRVITSVGIGTKIIINGTTYTVTNMERNIPNDAAAVDYLYKHNAAITFQTCETTRGANGRSHVRFWYAR